MRRNKITGLIRRIGSTPVNENIYNIQWVELQHNMHARLAILCNFLFTIKIRINYLVIGYTVNFHVHARVRDCETWRGKKVIPLIVSNHLN